MFVLLLCWQTDVWIAGYFITREQTENNVNTLLSGAWDQHTTKIWNHQYGAFISCKEMKKFTFIIKEINTHQVDLTSELLALH